MTERKGGCLLVPCYGSPGADSGVGGQAPPGMSWQMGRNMLKFRPIAPKPVAKEPVPTPAAVAAAAAAEARRGKRKAVGGGGGSRRGRKLMKAATVAPVSSAPPVAAVQAVGGERESEREKPLSPRPSSSSGKASLDLSRPSPPASQQPATLPLMPVSPVDEEAEDPAPVEVPAPATGAQPVALLPTLPAASSSVTVEYVTSMWRDGEAPSAAAAASACGADGEAAPAFVSNQWGRVTWANAGFARAVSGDDNGDGAAAVRLAGALPAWGTCAGFTCRVRVQHASPRRGGSVVAPCDVWRLDTDGCYLWRLDLQAALTLGSLPG